VWTRAHWASPIVEDVPRPIDVGLRALSRSANKGRLWLGLATVGALVTRGRTRRAAIRGAGSLAASSLLVNAAVKPLFRRQRPDIELTPLVRRLSRQPWTTSFPSGHAASAAAFTCGVGLEKPTAAIAIAPVAGAVAYSRVHVGVHFASDVVAGAALGAGAALALRRWWPVLPSAAAPVHVGSVAALPAGRGMLLAINPNSGSGPPNSEQLADLLPDAELLELTPELDLEAELDRRDGQVRALGVAGGDGTISSLVPIAVRRKLPMAIFPAGTMNHFARDAAIESFEDTSAAVEAGTGVEVDVGVVAGTPFLNTASLGAYPEMVRRRDELARRLHKWPAMVVAAAQVLRRQRPLRLTVDGEDVEVWSLFVGNSRYLTRGPFPAVRPRLDDGLLDVQYLKVGVLSRTKAVLSALGWVGEHTGYRRWFAADVRVESRDGRVDIATDGEPGELRETLDFGKLDERLLIYRKAEPGLL
jgi:undecaprenyl-diphosphatase